MWEIGNGGYDLQWQLCYDGTPLIDCIDGHLDIINDTHSNIDEVIDIICTEYHDIELPKFEIYMTFYLTEETDVYEFTDKLKKLAYIRSVDIDESEDGYDVNCIFKMPPMRAFTYERINQDFSKYLKDNGIIATFDYNSITALNQDLSFDL